jgi:ribose 5-phosphate isomerase A
MRVRAVPSSDATARLASALGIPLVSLEEAPSLDLAVDGADEIDPALRLIKGGGGALLRERIVAGASRRVIIIADSSKLVPCLGRAALPVEVSRFGWPVAAQHLRALGAAPELRRGHDGAPFVTDEGHFILDCRFSALPSPEAWAATLPEVPGVLSHGLFLGLADEALISDGATLRRLRAPRAAARQLGCGSMLLSLAVRARST